MNTMEDTEEPQPDWRDKRSMSDCLVILSENKMWHDVSFSCKNNNGKLLHGHRLLLSLRSPVFEAMFFGSLADKRDTVDIADIDYDVFEHILRYIYTGENDIDGENFLPILYGAKKYCLSGLADACSLFLESELSSDIVCDIYELAKMFNMKALVQTCFVYMTQHSSAVSLSTGSSCLSHDSLMQFLSNKSLTGVELDHFMLANKWAEQKCVSEDMEPIAENKRKVLGDIVTSICYPIIKAEDFAEVVAPTNILLPEDQNRIFQFMITGNRTYIEKYSFPPRRGLPVTIHTTKFEGPTTDEESFIFKFCCNADVILVKLYPVRVRGIDDFGVKYVEYVNVFRKNSNRYTMIRPTSVLDENGSIGKGLGVLFKANETYTIRLMVRGRSDNKEGPARNISIPTWKSSHTTCVGRFSCTVKQIPVCVETVEFKVVS